MEIRLLVLRFLTEQIKPYGYTFLKIFNVPEVQKKLLR